MSRANQRATEAREKAAQERVPERKREYLERAATQAEIVEEHRADVERYRQAHGVRGSAGTQPPQSSRQQSTRVPDEAVTKWSQENPFSAQDVRRKVGPSSLKRIADDMETQYGGPKNVEQPARPGLRRERTLSSDRTNAPSRYADSGLPNWRDWQEPTQERSPSPKRNRKSYRPPRYLGDPYDSVDRMHHDTVTDMQRQAHSRQHPSPSRAQSSERWQDVPMRDSPRASQYGTHHSTSRVYPGTPEWDDLYHGDQYHYQQRNEADTWPFMNTRNGELRAEVLQRRGKEDLRSFTMFP